MTDRINLDDLDVETDDDQESTPRRGDWFWRGDGDPDDEPGAETVWASVRTESSSDDEGGATDPNAGNSNRTSERARRPVPRVPRSNEDRPVGIPIEGGGAGSGRETKRDEQGESSAPAGREASGPHGGDTDEMTMALTYGAAKRLADPQNAFADATRWTDWIGIVGDVAAPVLTKFQRDHGIDADFFNGSGTGPGERLAEIDERSMFYAERMVVVGSEGEDESVAETAGWEFVPLSEAAAKAGWELT